MDLPLAWCQVCICGRTFSLPQAYTYHKRSCQKTKKRLAGALEKAKEVWQTNKRRETEAKAAKGALGLRSSESSHLNALPVATTASEPPTPAASPEVRFILCSNTTFATSNISLRIRGQTPLRLWMSITRTRPSHNVEVDENTANYPSAIETCSLTLQPRFLCLCSP
jgi:hypothetical protein